MSQNIALVFPGQGSQSQGMISDFYDTFSEVKATFEEANDSLGYDLWNIICNDTDKLSQTEYTQPALLSASVAILRVLNNKVKITPKFTAGHSLGEYSALVAAGAIEFKDAVKLVSLRGQFMQTAVPAGIGGVSAILGLADQDVITLCKEAAQGEVVSAVNFNAPGQVVIAGHIKAVERANALAKDKGAKKTQMLPVSVPVHCELMKPAGDKLADFMNSTKVSSPALAVLHNVDVNTHNNPDDIREILVKQIYSPVRWSESVSLIHKEGVDTFIEVGAGKVLTGLAKRIAKGATLFNTANIAAFESVLSEIF
jgi:[acyl-carrier-protein] S-malonyltransferase